MGFYGNLPLSLGNVTFCIFMNAVKYRKQFAAFFRLTKLSLLVESPDSIWCIQIILGNNTLISIMALLFLFIVLLNYIR